MRTFNPLRRLVLALGLALAVILSASTVITPVASASVSGIQCSYLNCGKIKNVGRNRITVAYGTAVVKDFPKCTTNPDFCTIRYLGAGANSNYSWDVDAFGFPNNCAALVRSTATRNVWKNPNGLGLTPYVGSYNGWKYYKISGTMLWQVKINNCW